MNVLTAEQVREAIFNGSAYASYDGAKYYADGIHMQAIADELNARAERTCRNIDIETCGYFICSECKTSCSIDYELSGWGTPRYCPNCGAKVVS